MIRFDLDPAPGNEERVCLPHPEVISAMKVGSTLLLDDGKVRIRVIEQGADFLLGRSSPVPGCRTTRASTSPT